jgi:DUF917 family protein
MRIAEIDIIVCVESGEDPATSPLNCSDASDVRIVAASATGVSFPMASLRNREREMA